jgi:hypothetical protein
MMGPKAFEKDFSMDIDVIEMYSLYSIEIQ